MIQLQIVAAQHRITGDEELNITHVVILLLIKLKFMEINKKAPSTGKSSFLRVIVLQCIHPSEKWLGWHQRDCLWFKQRLSGSG